MRAPAPATALVTGAAGGIGQAICLHLVAAGHDLVVVDQHSDALHEVQARLTESGRTVEVLVVDLGDPVDIADRMGPLFARVPVGIIINNAGTAVAADVVETSRADWERIFAVNVQAIYEICRLAVPGMVARGGGVIVNIASAAGLVGLRSRAAYCASKGAVIALTRAMAADHAAAGIRVNAVCPGTVATGWIDDIVRTAADPEATRANMAQRQLVGRLGTPEEIADAVAFTVDNTFMTGGILVVDGGMTTV